MKIAAALGGMRVGDVGEGRFCPAVTSFGFIDKRGLGVILGVMRVARLVASLFSKMYWYIGKFTAVFFFYRGFKR